MNAKQFFKTVVKMREAQKLYFKTKSSMSLNDAKELERIIDKEIERVNDLINKKLNPTIW